MVQIKGRGVNVMAARSRFVRGAGIPPADQVHIDLGALDERVRGVERAFSDVNGQLGDLRNQIAGISSSFADQMARLSEKMDKRLEAKPTNWIGFTTASAAIVGVTLSIGTAIMIPVFGDLRQLGDDIKNVMTMSATAKEVDAAIGRGMATDEKIVAMVK